MSPKPLINLEILKVQLPIMGWVSILHRLTGLFLFVAIPVLLLGLEYSLSNQENFEHTRLVLSIGYVKLMELVLIWAYFQHLFSGIRHLVLDMHRGLELAQARRSSVVVMAASLAATFICGVGLW